MNVLITFTTIGTDAGPFYLYSDVSGFTMAFEAGVTRAQLLAGFPSNNVPDGTAVIRAKSFGACTNFVDLPIPGVTTTTTTTADLCPGETYVYVVEIYNCYGCNFVGTTPISNATQLTIGKFFNVPPSVYKIASFSNCSTHPPTSFLLDVNGKDTCLDAQCPSTTTTTTTEVGPGFPLFISAGSADGLSACEQATPTLIYSDNVLIFPGGAILYEDSFLTTLFNGGLLWYETSVTSGSTFQVDSDGNIIDEFFCP